MANKKKALQKASQEVGIISLNTAHHTVHGLVKASKFTMQEIADCIGKTRPTLRLILTTPDYPLELVEVLECLGYKVEMNMDVRIDNEVEGDV